MDSSASIEGRSFYQGLLEALARAMGTAKGYLTDHGPRTAILATFLGRRLGLTDAEVADLFFAGVLADVGMIGLADDAWEDPVPVLPPAAKAEVETHPGRSAEVVRSIPFVQGAESLIRHHHEWWDGGGYPDRLSGSEIPFGARILRLADTVTALGEARPHRPERTPDVIREIVTKGSGTEFDPSVAELWLDLDRGKWIPGFQAGLYRDVCGQALEILVPAHVPVASAPLLLDLFSSLIDAKDPYTGGHSRRVAHLAVEVTRELGYAPEVLRHVRAAGYLHDLGKLSVPSRILRKPERLDREEAEQVRLHAADGARVLEDIPALRAFAPACRHHHERWDGAGYPEGLSRDRIPYVARVLGVCDAYDAMTSARAYRPPLSTARALQELKEGVGTQFSPRETEVLLSLPSRTFEEIGLPTFDEPVGASVPRGVTGRGSATREGTARASEPAVPTPSSRVHT